MLVTNRLPNPADRFNGFRERIAVDLQQQPEGHCSAPVLQNGRFTDDPVASRNGTAVGSHFDFVIVDTLKTQQQVSVDFGRIHFVGDILMDDAAL